MSQFCGRNIEDSIVARLLQAEQELYDLNISHYCWNQHHLYCFTYLCHIVPNEGFLSNLEADTFPWPKASCCQGPTHFVQCEPQLLIY